MATLIKTGQLKALLRFAGNRDIRYYLNGIYFDPAGYAIATDGHRLLAVHIEPFDGPGFIVERDIVKTALTLAGKSAVNIQVDEKVCHTIPHKPIDGKFPEWRRIVPSKVSGEIAYVQPDYLQDAMGAWHDMGLSKRIAALPFTMNGEGGVLQTCDQVPDAIAIIMPVRMDAHDSLARAAEFVKRDAKTTALQRPGVT